MCGCRPVGLGSGGLGFQITVLVDQVDRDDILVHRRDYTGGPIATVDRDIVPAWFRFIAPNFYQLAFFKVKVRLLKLFTKAHLNTPVRVAAGQCTRKLESSAVVTIKATDRDYWLDFCTIQIDNQTKLLYHVLYIFPLSRLRRDSALIGIGVI